MPESEIMRRVRAAQRARGIPVTPLAASEREPTAAEAVGKTIAAILLTMAAGGLAWLAYGQLRPLFHGPEVNYWQAVAAGWVLAKLRQFIKR